MLDAIAVRDWERLRPLLHPYLRWNDVHGRVKVLAMLGTSGPQEPPASYELRDGQIYRWRSEQP